MTGVSPMGAIFTNFAAGTITDSPLTNTAVAINSVNFAALPVVATPDFLHLVLDPAATAGVPEVVKVTAHTLGSTTVTVTRGQQLTQGGSAARQHNGGTTWVHALTALDLDALPYRILTTKGDTLGTSGLGVAIRVPVGGDQSFLRADSTQTAGYKWGNVGSVPVFATGAARDAVMSVPSIGQGAYIKSNDVNEGLYFNSSAGSVAPGLYRAPWNMPWGYIGSAQGSVSGVSTVADVTGALVTWTAVANRRYRVRGIMGVTQQTAAGLVTMRLTDVSNTQLTFCQDYQGTAGQPGHLAAEAYISPAAGSYTVKMRVETANNTVNTLAGATIISVEDVGPSGAPA